MSVLNVINSPWAIEQKKLEAIQKVYVSRMTDGSPVTIAAAEKAGIKLDNKREAYDVVDGVAVIPMHGVMGKRMNLFTKISGGVSTELIAKDIISAAEDPAVKAIMLHIDSPGGTVDGTETLANVVKQAGQVKPVVSYVDGLMASAAYWVGSAASMIIAGSKTDHIGSIGVVTSHVDVSKAEEKAGIKTTEITAGKYKRAASQYEPLSAEGEEVLRDQVDQIYSIFVDTVAENRGTDIDTVLNDMAEGRIFIATDAVRRGLIDDIASFEQTIFNIKSGVWPMATKQLKESKQKADNENLFNDDGVVEGSIETKESPVISIELIKADYPEIFDAIALHGADCERARIQGCEESSLPGHEALVNSMKFDGFSKGSDVAVAIIKAEKDMRAAHGNDFSANAPEPVDPVLTVDSSNESAAAANNLPLEERAKQEFDSSSELQKEFGTFGAYYSYCKVIDNVKH